MSTIQAFDQLALSTLDPAHEMTIIKFATKIPQEIVDILKLGPNEAIDPKNDPPIRRRKRIGYWRALKNPSDPIPNHIQALGTAPLEANGGYDGDMAKAFQRLPWPGDYLDADMPSDRREMIASSLNSAVIVARYMGNSRSRLQPMGLCGGVERGNDDWIWPVGLAHYVLDHGLVLDPDFLVSLGVI